MKVRVNRLHQHRLGAPIGFERAMEFEMFAGDVGDDGDIVGNLVNPVKRQPAGGRFDDGALHPLVAHLRQQRLYLRRFEGGEAGVVRPALLADLEVTVLIRPVRRPAVIMSASMMLLVVVLPSVPVTPMISI